MVNWKFYRVVLQQCHTNRQNGDTGHSVCNNVSKLMYNFVLILHRADAYCYSTVLLYI